MANRYWILGSGNTSDTAHWSTSSGGSGGAAIPTASDLAIFDAASNATAYTVTVNNAFVSAGATVGDPLTGIVSFTTDANATRSWSLAGNVSVAATFTAGGNSATNRLLIQSSVLGTPRTITCPNVSHGNVDYMDITGAGAGWASATTTGTIGDCLGNSGITFTPAAPQYWKTTTTGTKTWSTVGNWFLATNGGGGAGRVPLPQDNVVFDANSIGATGTATIGDMPRMGADITWTGVTNSPIFQSSVIWNLFGSLTLASGMTFTQNQGVFFYGRGNHTLTSAGKAWGWVANILSFGGSYSLLDAFSCANALQLANGTFNDGGFSVTALSFSNSNSNTRTLNATGLWNLTGSGATWQTSNATGFTLTSAPSLIKFTDPSATAKAFAGGGKTYNNLWFSGFGPGAFQVTGANTFADLHIDRPANVQFTAGTTTTVSSLTVPAYAGDAKYGVLPGVIGSYFSTPSAMANQITGDIGLAWYGAPASWQVTPQTFIGKSNVNSYIFAGITGSALRFRTTGTNSVSATSTTGHSFAAGNPGWVGVTWKADNGSGGSTTTFYTSADGVTWTQLGSPVVTSGAGTINSTSDGVEISSSGLGTSAQLVGKVSRAKIFNSATLTGTPVVDFNPNDFTSGNTWTSSTTGEQWTRNGQALIYPEVKLSGITNATWTLAKAGGGVVAADYINSAYMTVTGGTAYVGQTAHSTNGGNNNANVIFSDPPNNASFGSNF